VLLAPPFEVKSPILMTWRDRAACLGVDPELFFPIGNTGPALSQIEEAKVVCRRCEVVEPA
jgi:WhiB family transcriptional regulator, redox-sensing transcriptional regulator